MSPKTYLFTRATHSATTACQWRHGLGDEEQGQGRDWSAIPREGKADGELHRAKWDGLVRRASSGYLCILGITGRFPIWPLLKSPSPHHCPLVRAVGQQVRAVV
jgi:hypothetical protein